MAGSLFPIIIAIAVVVLVLPFLSQGAKSSMAPSVVPSGSRVKAIMWLSAAAFILWSVSRGFEVLGPIYLRSSTNNGLMWLTVLIISESILLQWIDRLKSNVVIVLAALMWAGVYGLFAYGLSPVTACAALLLAGFNCPAQVVLQAKVGVLFPGMPTAQAALSISGAAGGFAASLFYVLGRAATGREYLGILHRAKFDRCPLIDVHDVKSPTSKQCARSTD